jgi:hypothetical protein
MEVPSVGTIEQAASKAAFGAPLVQNNLRGLVAEIIVGCALEPDWRRSSGDWSGWDFEHKTDKTRLEVKQSAFRQTWDPPKCTPKPRFDIAARDGYLKGVAWTAQKGRNAHIYVFGLHKVMDDTADHRNVSQWCFYVVSAAKLPAGKTIGLPGLERLSAAHTWEKLREAVARERIEITKQLPESAAMLQEAGWASKIYEV